MKIDVGEIYDIDLGDNYVAWVPDQIDITLKKEKMWLDNFNMPKNKQYINSGVLLLNLEAYKKDNIEQKLIENYKKFKDVAMLQKIFNHYSPQVTLRYIGIEQDKIDESYNNFIL